MKKKYLQVLPSGYGKWKVTTEHYGKEISCTTSNSMAVDDYKDDNERTSNKGYRELRNECIRLNKKS